MAIKDIGFRIKPVFAGQDAQKALLATRKDVRAIGDETVKLNKLTKESLKSVVSQVDKWHKSIKDASYGFRQWADSGITSINRVRETFDKLKGSVLNVRTAIAGTIAGAMAFKTGRMMFEAGTRDLAVRNRLRREFGGDAERIERIAGGVARRAGITNADAAAGLIPLSEQLDVIQQGSRFRGVNRGRALTAAQADALRAKNLQFGAELLGRLRLLAPDVSNDDAGRVLADALTGPEGIRAMISTFNLQRRSRKLSAANEKGMAFKELSVEEQKRFGITKAGQYLEQGDLVQLMLARSGLTGQAADAARGKLSNQVRAIGASLEDAIGTIGSRAMEKLNQGLGKGATLAEKLQNYLSSKEGQETISKISDAVAKIAESAVRLVQKLPEVASFLSEHKTSLMLLGGAYYGLKASSFIGGLGKGGGGLPGMGGGGLPVGGVPVNLIGAAGGVISALAAAFAIAKFADEKYKIRENLGNMYDYYAHPEKLSAPQKFVTGGALDFIKAKFLGVDDQTIAKAYSQGFAKEYASNPEAFKTWANKQSAKADAQEQAEGGATAGSAATVLQAHTTINLDGRVLANAVTEHQVRGVRRATANGAAPLQPEH